VLLKQHLIRIFIKIPITMTVTAALADIIGTPIFLKRINEEMTDRLNQSTRLNKRFTPLVFKRIIRLSQ